MEQVQLSPYPRAGRRSPELPQGLSVTEALRLLRTVPFGRVVFTSHALPAVRLVRHVLVAGQVVIAADPDVVLGPASRPSQQAGTILAYEADQFDDVGRPGWSVVVIGHARLIADSTEVRRYRSFFPELAGTEALIAISAEVVSGVRLDAARDQRESAPI